LCWGWYRKGCFLQLKYTKFTPKNLIKMGVSTLFEYDFNIIRYDLILNKKHNTFFPKSLGKLGKMLYI